MGAQVYNQMIHQQSPAPPRLKTSMRPALSRANTVKRNLFGKTISAEVKHIFESNIKEQAEEKGKRWSFDFVKERPLENGTFVWQKVVQPVAPVTPPMITLTQAAHVPTERRLPPIRRSNSNSSSSSTTSIEELMDERASRGNVVRDALEDDLDDSFSSSTSTLSPAVPAERSEPETIDTYPTLRNQERIIREIRRGSPQRTAPASPPKLRQPQITEFLQERKRLPVPSAERISVKKVRLMGPDGASSSSSSSSGPPTDVASTSKQSSA